MRSPASSPLNYLWSILLVLALGGMISIGQAVYVGIWNPTPPLIVAFAASAVVFVAACLGIRRVGREMKAWAAGDHPWIREDVAKHMGPVLAEWTYTADEWRAYTEREYRLRRGQTLGFAAAAAVIGGTVTLGRGAPLWMAAAAAAVFGVLGAWAWWSMHRRKHRENLASREPRFTIAANAVLFDGRRQFLGETLARLSGVRFLEAERPPVLQVTIAFPGTLTSTWDMRIPVPRGREGEARALAASFAAGAWGAAPRSAVVGAS